MKRRSICAFLCATMKGRFFVFPQPFIKGSDRAHFGVSHWQQGGPFPWQFAWPKHSSAEKKSGLFNDSPLIFTFLSSRADRGPGRFSEKLTWQVSHWCSHKSLGVLHTCKGWLPIKDRNWELSKRHNHPQTINLYLFIYLIPMIKCLSFIKEAEARVAIGTIITKFSVEVVLTPEKKKRWNILKNLNYYL